MFVERLESFCLSLMVGTTDKLDSACSRVSVRRKGGVESRYVDTGECVDTNREGKVSISSHNNK